MALAKLQLFKVRIKSFKSTLENASEKTKKGRASITLTENFNSLIEEIGKAYPDIKPALPKKIKATGPFARVGASDANYVDLEVYAEQVIGILDLLGEGTD